MGAQYQVIDNFLPTYQFKTLESLIMTSEKFPWYLVNNTVSLENPHYNVKDFQFVHAFYSGGKITSQFFSDFESVLTLLGATKLNRIKANLRPRTTFHRRGGYHIDYADVTTAILYMNTCNGWTHFKKGGKVKSVANRLVKFDSNQEHQGVTCTDEKVRVVINFNYA